jgi:hypothetical protein
MSRLVRLYPRPWRDRYEAEFLGLIAERPLTLIERFDVVRGALDARLHPQVRPVTDAEPLPPEPDADLRVARRLGFAAVIGAVLWPAAFAVAAMGPIRYDDYGAYRDGGAAFPIIILAVALLAGGLIGHLIRLPANSWPARVSAGVAIPCLLLFGLAPWLFPFALTATGLIVVLAVAGLRSGAWPPLASLAVVAAGIAVAVIFAIGLASQPDRMSGGALFVAAGLALVPAWLAIGAVLLRPPVLSADAAR